MLLHEYLQLGTRSSPRAWWGALISAATLFFSAHGLVYAQEHKLSFERLGDDQGLAKAMVFSVVQDRTGLLWLGTSLGVYRYDGYNFIAYRRTPAGQKPLPSDHVEAVYEDHQGQLWVGHISGLSKLDRATGTFQDVALPIPLAHGQGSSAAPSVSSIYQDRQQTLWVGTRNGLYQWERVTGQWRRFAHDLQDPTSLSADNVSSICEDRAGQLWIATFGGGLNRFEPARDNFSVWRHQPRVRHSLADNQINALAADPDGSLWIATETAGLDQFDPTSQTFTHYRYSARSPHGLPGDNVGAVYVDRQGQLWVGVGLSGLARFERQTGRFTHFKQEAANSLHLDMAIYQDREGTLWVGDRGLRKVKQRQEALTIWRNNPQDSNTLSDDRVRTIWEDRAGRLWVGTQNGLNRIDRAAERVTRYQHNPRNPHRLAHNFVSQIYEDRAGRLWIATSHNKLAQYHPARDDFVPWLPAPGARDRLKADNARSIRSLYEDSRGQFWLAVYDEGLCQFDRAKRTLIKYQHQANDPQSLSNDRVKYIYETSDGVLWVATNQGLNRFDHTTGRFTRFLHDANDPYSLGSDDVQMMLEDKAGNFWLATSNNGLNLMDRATGRFTRFTEKDGLCDNALAGLLEDAEGNLWLSAQTCLARFNPRTRTFRNFTIQDGAEFAGFRARVCFRSPRGELFFGGNNGVLAFFPDQLQEQQQPPPVVLTSFSKFNQPVNFGRALTEVPEIELSWRDDFFSFEFAALSYIAPEQNQYAYRMEGFNQDWVYSGTRRYASYTSLPAGDYVFRVKAANSDGVWNHEGAAIKVRILPPFYRTWWFVSWALLSLGGLITLLYRWRVTRLRNEHATKEAFSRQLLASQEMFSRQLLESQESDRKRIAAELHDGLGQSLVIIKNRALHSLTEPDDHDRAIEQIEEIADAATHAILEARAIAYNLRPFHIDRLGLTAALRAMIKRAENDALHFTTELDLIDGLLTPEQEINFYRIVQECLNNIIKHAQASAASVTIKRHAALIELTIQDNGRGFTPGVRHESVNGSGFGLLGLTERARILGGALTITSAPGHGTTTHLELTLACRETA